ncbi:hypothetical protein KY342_01640, partial [Candidatus Woesearchaeota archaeon]|nr:hypothetical protein [Candidatus Woesearchaeota archaeon]
VNASYTIIISNNGAVTDNYTLTIENINSASTAVLNQSSITIPANENRSVMLYVTDDDTVGEYITNVNITSDNDGSISEEISITTTVYGVLSAYIIYPESSPPSIYYEAQPIPIQGYVYDELSNAINGATVTLEPITGAYVYSCTNISDIGSGYYNCTKDSSGMQTSEYYDIRINASKSYYHNATFTNSTVFLLSVNQEANLTLTKSASVYETNGTHIVYNITNTLTNIKGTSTQTNLTDPDKQIWNLGNLSAGTITRSYLLTFARALEEYQVTLNKSNATGYDVLYDNSLFAESNQPNIIIPENVSLRQLTVIKSLVAKNDTSTNITYEITIQVVNSGFVSLENITVNDTDINLSTLINLTKGASWDTTDDLLIQKNPQPFIKEFAIATASHENYTANSTQQNISIDGYGGPYDVVITSLPSSVNTGQSITGQVEVTNQNTEVEEDRTLTTWIEDVNGTVSDIDIRTVFVDINDSITVDITLTAPSSTGTYYFISELTWPTATANATRSFTVTTAPSVGGGGARTITEVGVSVLEVENITCGDGICNLTETLFNEDECLEDCGYDCDGNGIGDSWIRCTISFCQMPDDLKKDIITLKNRINVFEKDVEKLTESGVSTQEVLDLINELKEMIDEIEDKIAHCEFDEARNLIRNAYVRAGTTVVVEKPVIVAEITGAAVIEREKLYIPWKLISSIMLIIIVIALIIGGAYYRYEQYEVRALMLLRARRRKLERINGMIDETIDKIYLKKRRY